MAELAITEVTEDGSEPDRWVALLHGIYGAGRNWRSVARSLVAARPDWGALLVDLRQHGGSAGFPSPHSVEAAAADLETVRVPGSVRALLGHSFGGKVALVRARDSRDVDQAWVVDSTPESREPSGGAWEMLQVLQRMPDGFESRDAAVEALVEAGVEQPVALWVSTNLERRVDRYVWGIDFDDMEALLRDFFRLDLWDIVERPRDGLELHFIRATRSSVLSADAVARLRAAGQSNGRVFLHEVQGGHWLNADNPDAVVELLRARL